MSENWKIENQRKIKLINRGFQFRLAAKFIFLNTVILAIFGLLIYIFFHSEISANLASAHAAYTDMSRMVLPIVLTLSILNILLTAGIMAIMVVYWSHKIAGPLYRFNEALKEMGEGNLNPLTKLRVKDQLQELGDSLERVSELLSGDMIKAKGLIEEIKNDLDDRGALKEKVEQLEGVIGKYRT